MACPAVTSWSGWVSRETRPVRCRSAMRSTPSVSATRSGGRAANIIRARPELVNLSYRLMLPRVISLPKLLAKRFRADNRHASEAAEQEQVLVARDDRVGPAVDGAGDDYIRSRILRNSRALTIRMLSY